MLNQSSAVIIHQGQEKGILCSGNTLCPSSRGDVTGRHVSDSPGQCCIRSGKEG